MSHPLVSLLQELSQLLQSSPQHATSREAVTALDKVTVATRNAIEIIHGAAQDNSPEAQALQKLLAQAYGKDASEKEAKKILQPLLIKLPSRKKGSTLAEYLDTLALTTAKAGKASVACSLIRQHLDRPRFDTTTRDTYELLKQIRQLGQMDIQQKKAAQAHLEGNHALVEVLCAAASIPTAKGKIPKPVPTKSLVKQLMQHGERYAENASS
jgi:predicted Zn-dependent protease